MRTSSLLWASLKSVLFPRDGDQVLIRILSCWEYDVGSSGVTHIANFANEELVVLWPGVDVSETLGLLLLCQVQELLLGFSTSEEGP